MIKGKVISLSVTRIAAAAIKEGQLVGYDNKPTGANGVVLGVAAHDAEVGDAVTVDVLGLTDMVAAAAVSAEAVLSSSASGLPVSGGTNPFGRALNAANPGGRVSVLLIPR